MRSASSVCPSFEYSGEAIVYDAIVVAARIDVEDLRRYGNSCRV